MAQHFNEKKKWKAVGGRTSGVPFSFIHFFIIFLMIICNYDGIQIYLFGLKNVNAKNLMEEMTRIFLGKSENIFGN
jgi:hypothetical protein